MKPEDRQALRELVERWLAIATEVEYGYQLTFDDYLNDLDVRRLISEALQQIDSEHSGFGPGPIALVLQQADELFLRSTIPTETNVWGAANELENGWNPEAQWYYYRLPEQLPEDW